MPPHPPCGPTAFGSAGIWRRPAEAFPPRSPRCSVSGHHAKRTSCCQQRNPQAFQTASELGHRRFRKPALLAPRNRWIGRPRCLPRIRCQTGIGGLLKRANDPDWEAYQETPPSRPSARSRPSTIQREPSRSEMSRSPGALLDPGQPPQSRPGAPHPIEAGSAAASFQCRKVGAPGR